MGGQEHVQEMQRQIVASEAEEVRGHLHRKGSVRVQTADDAGLFLILG